MISGFFSAVMAVAFVRVTKKTVRNCSKLLSVVNYTLLGVLPVILVLRISTILLDLFGKTMPKALVFSESVLFPFYLVTIGLHIWYNRYYFVDVEE